ncbi:MAG: hypothetical protein ACI8QZ_001369 [Chlamydiales bacterium]|jgi:hypothetical protein
MMPAPQRAERWYSRDRAEGLRRFAIAITVLNVLGYAYLGFEPALAAPFVALAAAYSTELLLETIGAWADRRRASYRGGHAALVNSLLPAHITAMAVSMLLYSTERLWPVAFAASAAIASKSIFRARVGKGRRHWLNPSNFGIAMTLVLFPWVGIAPPYMFTESLGALGDWALPGFIVVLGTAFNARYTRRLPLISAWLTGFLVQGWLRHQMFDTRFAATLMPMTGLAFLLFTFYMLTDPATTPARPRAQVLFGLGVAAAYGTLMVSHIVFGLFFALVVVSLVRGCSLYTLEFVTLVRGALTAPELLAEQTLQPAPPRQPLSRDGVKKPIS